ncbi:hypothetical protein [Nocardioides sp. InS609-2]|uniref:hypothetical protein n=1 Tax=Nocardioides sp. InS609-2 TaxID=2760705 RepID=UPI0020BDFC0B|nr:hypothetical protein [Nocardioides sp. InS609-2]
MSYDYDWCGHDGCGAPIERWSREWKHRKFELDTDHKAVPQQPVGPVEEGLHMRATRYAEALVVAAAADERITALTELLVQHEFYRTQAEQALSMVQEDPQFGTVWAPTGPEPDEGVSALLCLTTGMVYRRRQYGTGWQRAEHNPSTATGYEWPIQDAGPFIAWRDSYGFDAVLRQARKDETEFDALHRKLYGEPGYHGERGTWGGRPPLAEAIDRILMARSTKWAEQNDRALAAERKLAQLRRSLEYLEPDDTQQWPATQDGDDELRDVAVIDLQRVHDLLDRPEHGGAS